MQCFKWSVIAETKWEEMGDHPVRISKLKRYEDDFDRGNVKFPVSFRDINRFESRNEITINILSYEDKEIYICRKGEEYPRITGEPPQIANLMIIRDHNRRHYVAIKSLSRLLFVKNSKHKKSQHFCIKCLLGFKEVKTRDEHLIYCRDNEAVKNKMPRKKPIVKYSHGQYQFKVPFMMYADFESILTPIQGAPNDPNVSSTRGVNIHEPSGWCVYSTFSYGVVRNPLTQYRGKDCVRKFCEHVI